METVNPFGIYFNLTKIKYSVYDQSLESMNFLTPTDKVNVFINLETVLNYLSQVKDLDKKLITTRNFTDLMKADVINIAAHYKDFFVGNGLKTNVFLYMTDLNSELNSFKENQYVEDFRSYYLTKYTSNPRFSLLGERLQNEIFPEIKTICEFIPNVYMISSKNIDSGVVPAIIAESMPDYKNLIISGDIHDTQYYFENNFVSHLHQRTYAKCVLESTPNGYIKAIAKEEIEPETCKIFYNPTCYKLLLACIGDKTRSIDDIEGIKLKTLTKTLIKGISEGKITEKTSSAMMLADIFPQEIKGEVYSNLLAIDLSNSMQIITEGDKKSILSQIIDRSDINSLYTLNDGQFRQNPLRLESLLK